MKTAELLFELSHPTRLAILQLVDGQAERLTKVARKVDARNPETSRHLDRLGAAGLVEKTPEGAYSATPLGHLLLGSLGGVEFLTANEAYFRTHDLTGLPATFVGRLGDLRHGKTPRGTFSNFAQDEKIFGAAAQRLAVLATELPDGSFEAFEAKDVQGSKVQVVVEKGYQGPLPTESVRHLFRAVSKLPMAAAISESAACISFPARGGQMDYSAFFASEDPRFVRWALDVADWLWERGEYLR